MSIFQGSLAAVATGFVMRATMQSPAVAGLVCVGGPKRARFHGALPKLGTCGETCTHTALRGPERPTA
jgi:hypothetical protein